MESSDTPEFLSDPASLRVAVRAERARRNFSEFVREAWQFVPQCDPLIWGWHMEALCLHFEAVARGEIPKLLVNIPPGHAKSVMLAVLWPAWVWTWWPKCQFLFASYSATLSTRDSIRCRVLIDSEWYRDTFMVPGGWKLSDSQNTKDYFINTIGGERIAIGVGGTGRRAHIIGIDDPIDAVDIMSKAIRESTNMWIGQTLSQRFVDARSPKVAMIMQRLHEDDPSAFVLEGKDWEHLCLPSEFEPDRRCVTRKTVEKRNGHVEYIKEEFWRDPRTEAGQLLFAEKFPENVLEAFKLPNSLGADGYAGQHEQRPQPAGGGMFQRKAWRFWKPDGKAPDHGTRRPRGCWDGEASPLPTEFEEQLISVDATFRETAAGSYVAIHVWGRKGANRYLLDRVHRRMDFTATVNSLLRVIDDWPDALKKLIEGKANGDAITSTLTNSHGISGIIPVDPGTASKEQRAHAMQPYQAAGNCYLPDGAPWLDEYISEHAAFPKGRYNDDVDAQSQALQGFERSRGGLDAWGSVDLS